MTKLIFYVLLLNIINFSFYAKETGRYLVYPPGFGNKVQFIVGIGVPVSNLPTIQSVTWGYVIKTNYILPTNVTEYGNIRKFRKRSASISRWDFYRSVADVLTRSGLPGDECIKRSICETAQIKFASDDVIGEFMHILLLPSTTQDTDSSFHYAEVAGLSSSTNCGILYKSCPLSLINLFSVVSERFRANTPIFLM